MTLRYLLSPLVLLLMFMVPATNVSAQTDAPGRPDTTVSTADTTGREAKITMTRSSLDTTITFKAERRAEIDLRARKARLYGNAVLVKGSITLMADYIEVDFNNSALYARTDFDSTTGRYTGNAVVLRDGANEITAYELTYNLRTRQGTIAAAETKFDDGYFYAKKIRKVADNVLFGKDGVYTTCDAPHPHYYFTTPRMKVITGDRVFLDQVTLNVADVPIAYLPIGLFFPSRSGRNSGLIIPKFGQRGSLGFGIEGLGFFWDMNEYLDNTTTTDFYSKGGFTLRNATRFRLRGIIQQSDLRLTYGMRRNNIDEPLDRSYIVNYSHAQKIGRYSDLSGTFNYATRNAIRNTSTDIYTANRLQDITTQQLTSDISYSTSWRWGGAFRISHNRTQDIITDALTAQNQASFTLPAWTPFASVSGEGGVLDNFSLSGGVTATNQAVRQDPDSTIAGGFRTRDNRYGVRINPSISIAPKLSYFTVSPSISVNGGIFFRRIVKEPDGDTIRTRYIDGIYPTVGASGGITISTKLFGLVQPRIFGVDAIRHTFLPSVSWSYTPDFGRLGLYYDDYFDPQTNKVSKYSIFETDAGLGYVPPTGTQNLFSIGIQNTIDAKIAQGDTLDDKKVTLLTLNLNTTYNANKDSVKWSDISVNSSLNAGPLGTLRTTATLNLYVPDSLGRPTSALLIDRGQWFPRLTYASISFGMNFSDQGFNVEAPFEEAGDSAQARRARFDFEPIPFNEDQFFGDRVRGADEFRIPWDVSISGSYYIRQSSSKVGEFEKNFTINSRFNFSPTPTTRVSSSVSYDVQSGKFLIPQISFYKDLHCWEMSFNWVPGGGYGQGFTFRLSIKAPQLQDIKLERTHYE